MHAGINYLHEEKLKKLKEKKRYFWASLQQGLVIDRDIQVIYKNLRGMTFGDQMVFDSVNFMITL